MTSKSLKETYPIHWLVWHNEYRDLETLLSGNEVEIESKDPRGRTPLHLAVTLGHLESCRVLLRNGADANAENANYWTVIQEAVSTGDPELVQLCLQHRDAQRVSQRIEGIPGLLQKLREAPDFYVEMKWEFTSWIPLVSRMCPSDTYKVWKSGSNVRIDTTLLGFDNMNWQRGSRSYVFKGSAEEATVMEVDHDVRTVYCEMVRIMPNNPEAALAMPSEDAIAARLTSPLMTTYIDTEKIAFERNKSGIWGWRSDKVENVNDYECKVFSASNVELLTKTRTEHLTDSDKKKVQKQSRTPLESFLGIAEQHDKKETAGATANGELSVTANNPCSITPEEYFNHLIDLEGKDIGRPLEQITKSQKFKATLWLCEEYPLSLPEQVIPIIDLMAQSNAHFKKLKDFITLTLPAGFPVKIEIPLFHVLNARITFGNIFASDNPVEHVNCVKEDNNLSCVIDEACFEPPASYSRIGDIRHDRIRDEDDELLQFAIQQSLLESGTDSEQVTFWEALNKDKSRSRPLPAIPKNLQSEEDRQLQRAIEESIRMNYTGGSDLPRDDAAPEGEVLSTYVQEQESEYEKQLRMAMELSQRELTDAERLQKQEEEELAMILKLSLTDK